MKKLGLSILITTSLLSCYRKNIEHKTTQYPDGKQREEFQISHRNDSSFYINEYKSWYNNGQLHITGNYKDSRLNRKVANDTTNPPFYGRHGEWVYYDEKGNIKRQETYKYSLLDGEQVIINKNGKQKSTLFIDGVPFEELKRNLNATSKKVNYRNLIAGKEKEGIRIKIKGEIKSITKNGATIATGEGILGYFDKEFWLTYDSKKYPLLDDDIVTVWGKYQGPIELVSGLNRDITFEKPHIWVELIEINK